MKKIVLFLFLTSMFSYGQFKTNSNKQLYFEKIYEVDKSQDEIHKKALEWFARNFNDPDYVIKLERTDKIITSFTLPIKDQTWKLDFLLTIDVKENRYRLTIDEINSNANLNGKEFKTPLYDYDVITFEEWKVLTLNVAEEMGGDQLKKKTEKLIEKDGLKLFEQGKELGRPSVSLAKKSILNVSENLLVTIQKPISDW